MKTLESSLLHQFKDFRHALFYALTLQRNQKTLTLGGACQWTIQTGSISENSVVYSAGVGGDISFEKELIRQFGCDVILLDPSPTGIATMDQPQNRVAKLHYEAIGLAESDGTFSFEAPDGNTDGSYRVEALPGAGRYRFPCSSLPTLMRHHGHDHIDLLKIDIEGFEYGVLKQICAQKLPVKQICVEFHHSLVPGIRRKQTIGAIIRLLLSGYRLIHRKDWDHTFVARAHGGDRPSASDRNRS
jgi:FkbM family methyltransferase